MKHWTLYFHQINDDDWTIQSYKKLIQIESLDEFDIMCQLLTKLSDNRYYFMRGDILPEAPQNINGGGYTFKVNKEDMADTFNKTVRWVMRHKDNNIITGFSISPKRFFCSYRVWVSKAVHKSVLTDLLGDSLDVTNSRYTPNRGA